MILEKKNIELVLHELVKIYKTEPYVSKLKASLKEIKNIEKIDLRGYFVNNRNLIDTLLFLLDSSKVSPLIIEIVYTFLIADLFNETDTIFLIKKLCKRSWSTPLELKILQMIFYFMKHDIFKENSSIILLSFVLKGLKYNDINIQFVCRPIGVQLIEKLVDCYVKEMHKKSNISSNYIISYNSKSDLPNNNFNKICNNSIISHSDNFDTCHNNCNTNNLINNFTVNNINDKLNENFCSDQFKYELIRNQIVDIIELFFNEIHVNGIYSLSYFLLVLIRYPGFLESEKSKEFIDERIFTMIYDILKKGNEDDKKNTYDILLLIQKRFWYTLKSEFESFYSDLIQISDFESKFFYNFLKSMIKNIINGSIDQKNNNNTNNDSDNEIKKLIPLGIKKAIKHTISNIDFRKPENQMKIDFITDTISVMQDDLNFYLECSEEIIRKYIQYLDTPLNMETLIRDILNWSVNKNKRDLFELIQKECNLSDIILNLNNLKNYFKDSWHILLKRCNSDQKREIVENILDFNSVEIDYLISYIDEDLLMRIFDLKKDLFLEEENMDVFINLLKKYKTHSNFFTVLIKYYSEYQKKKKLKNDQKNFQKIKYDDHFNNFRSYFPYEPLICLKLYIEEYPEYYSNGLETLIQIINITGIYDCWDIVFSIISIHSECLRDQVSIILFIVQKYLEELNASQIKQILDFVRLMILSEDYNICLKGLYIYQEIGEFLVEYNEFPDIKNEKLKILEFDQIQDNQLSCQENINRDDISNEFLTLGISMISDNRSFIHLSLIKFIFIFIFNKYEKIMAIYGKRFLEEEILDKIFAITNDEVKLQVLNKINMIIRKYGIPVFVCKYLEYLETCIFSDNEVLIEDAITSLNEITFELHNDMNNTVIRKNKISFLNTKKKLLEDKKAFISNDKNLDNSIDLVYNQRQFEKTTNLLENEINTKLVIKNEKSHIKLAENGQNILDIQKSDDQNILDIQKSDDQNILDIQKSDDQNILDIQKSDDQNILDIQKSDDQNLYIQKSDDQNLYIQKSDDQNIFYKIGIQQYKEQIIEPIQEIEIFPFTNDLLETNQKKVLFNNINISMFELRKKIIQLYFQIFAHFTDKKVAFLIKIYTVLELIKYDYNEIKNILNLTELAILNNKIIFEQTVNLIEKVCRESGFPLVALTLFSNWIKIGLYKNDVLLYKIQEIMKDYNCEWDDSIYLAMMSIAKGIDDEYFEQILECIIKGFANISKNSFNYFVDFISSFVYENFKLIESQRKKHCVSKFFDFFMDLLGDKAKNINLITENLSVAKGFELVDFLSKNSYRTLRLKSYQFLFLNSSKCHLLLINNLKRLFANYYLDYINQGNNMEIIRRIEVIYCLNYIISMKNISIVNNIKFELIDLLLCKDNTIVSLIRQCFYFYFKSI